MFGCMPLSRHYLKISANNKKLKFTSDEILINVKRGEVRILGCTKAHVNKYRPGTTKNNSSKAEINYSISNILSCKFEDE